MWLEVGLPNFFVQHLLFFCMERVTYNVKFSWRTISGFNTKLLLLLFNYQIINENSSDSIIVFKFVYLVAVKIYNKIYIITSKEDLQEQNFQHTLYATDFYRYLKKTVLTILYKKNCIHAPPFGDFVFYRPNLPP